MSGGDMATAPSRDARRPLVSVVINNYNYGRYLRAAIDSSLAQSYPQVEVVVVDDGSTDDSREVIESYGNRIIPLIKSNGGQGSAFNAGFAASQGEIVIFLDADDELLDDAVDRVVKAWRPGVAKVQFQLELVDDGGKSLGMLVPQFNGFIPNGDIRDRIVRFGEYPTPLQRQRILPCRAEATDAAGRSDLAACGGQAAIFPDALFWRPGIALHAIGPLSYSCCQRLASQGSPSGSPSPAIERSVFRPGDDLPYCRIEGDRTGSPRPEFNLARTEAQDRFDSP